MPAIFEYAPGILFLTLCYAALCAASPLGTCRACKGWGAKIRVSRFTGRIIPGRFCRRCDGQGRRIRLGRRFYNLAVSLHRDSTR